MPIKLVWTEEPDPRVVNATALPAAAIAVIDGQAS